MVSTCWTSGWSASVEDLAAQLGVVAVQPHDQRLVDVLALGLEQFQGLHDAVRDGVAGGDAAEDVDEDGLHVRVAEDDLQAVRHDLGGRAAADVEEVGGLDVAVRLTGVGDDVEGRHDQARAVADDADLAVELDVVQALGLGGRLERVGRGLVLERRVVRLAELGVRVQRHLAVQRDDLAVAGLDQRVDLDEEGVLPDEDVPQLLQHVHDLVGAARPGTSRPRRSRGPWPRSRPRWRRPGSWRGPRAWSPRPPRSPRRPRRTPWRGRCGWCGPAGRRRSTPPRCPRSAASITLWTVWPLMSMPRMARAFSTASAGSEASFTPPALPRPPVFTCALTTARPPSRSVTSRAASGVSMTSPASTGTSCLAKRSLAWYSNRSTRVRPLNQWYRGRLSACVGVPRGRGSPDGARHVRLAG